MSKTLGRVLSSSGRITVVAALLALSNVAQASDPSECDDFCDSLTALADSDPGKVFDIWHENPDYRDMPWMGPVIRQAAENIILSAPDEAIERIRGEACDGEAWQAELLQQAVERAAQDVPRGVLIRSNDCRHCGPWGEQEMILKALDSVLAQGDALGVFAYIHMIKDDDVAEPYAKQAAELSSGAALRRPDRYVDRGSWGPEIFLQSALTAIDQDPGAFLEFAYYNKDCKACGSDEFHKLYKRVVTEENLRQAADNLANSDVRATFRHLPYFIDQLWAPDVLVTAADLDGGGAFIYLSTYIDQPWAPIVLKRAAWKDPRMALKHLPSYVDQPWAQTIAQTAVEMEPRGAFYHLPEHAQDTPWVVPLLQEAARLDCQGALKIAGELYGCEF